MGHLAVPAARWRVAITALALAAALTALTATAASADGPGVGTPTVVSVGDSYISGEAGRWAGNTNDSSSRTSTRSAPPPTTTTPTTRPSRSRCHRSKSAEVHIGGGVERHEPRVLGREDLDVHRRRRQLQARPRLLLHGGGNQGQALMLQDFAATHNVKMVVAVDRRQQLQLRRRSSQTCVDGLADLAVVVAGLLQRRLVGDGELHRRPTSRADDRDQERDPQHPHRR